MSKLDNMYYVYKHYLDDMLFYIGKGIHGRAFDFDGRSKRWKNLVKGNLDRVRVEIVGYFVSEADAYEVEKLLIKKYNTGDTKLTNHIYNPIKENILKEALKENGGNKDVDINDQLSFEDIIEYGAGNSPADILRMFGLENSGTSIIIERNSNMSIKIRREMIDLGYKALLIMPEEKYDESLTLSEKNSKDYFIKNKKLPKDYNYLIVASCIIEEMVLDINEINAVIINSSNIRSRNKTLMSFKGNSERLAYKSKGSHNLINNISIPNQFLNKYLIVENKDNLVNHLDIKNENGRQVKWPTIKELAKKSGYTVDDSVKVIDGKRKGVSIIKVNKNIR